MAGTVSPGIMMSVITNSYGNVVSSFFGAKFGKHVEELLVSPLPNWIIVSGYAVGGLVRGLMVGGVVTLVSLVFAHLPVRHPVLVIAAPDGSLADPNHGSPTLGRSTA